MDDRGTLCKVWRLSGSGVCGKCRTVEWPRFELILSLPRSTTDHIVLVFLKPVAAAAAKGAEGRRKAVHGSKRVLLSSQGCWSGFTSSVDNGCKLPLPHPREHQTRVPRSFRASVQLTSTQGKDMRPWGSASGSFVIKSV